MEPILSMDIWLSLKSDTRDFIRANLHIGRSGHIEVFDGRVLCDGTMMEDLRGLTTWKLQQFLDTKEEDFYKLFNRLIDVIEKPIPPNAEKITLHSIPVDLANIEILETPTSVPMATVEDEPKKKRNYARRNK